MIFEKDCFEKERERERSQPTTLPLGRTVTTMSRPYTAGPASSPYLPNFLSRLPRAAALLLIIMCTTMGFAPQAHADLTSFTATAGDGQVTLSATPAQANTAPTASNGTVTMKEDTAYTFAASDFNFSDTDMDDALEKVKIVTVETAGDLELDGTDVTANQEVTKANLDDAKLIFTPATDANGASYTTFTFKVNDGDTDSTDTYTMTINVESVPEVTQVSVTSTPRSGTTPKKYGAGENIQVTATFDEAVTVTGDPVVNVEVGSNSRPAAYASGSGTNALVFEYTVQSGDRDTNGIFIEADAVKLDADSGAEDYIRDGDSNNAILNHVQPGLQSDHQVDGSLTPPPSPQVTLVMVSVTSVPSIGPSQYEMKYGNGEKIQIVATFDEAVTVTGDPLFQVVVGSNTRDADYVSGSGFRTLVFEYTVQSGDRDADGIGIEADPIKLDADDLIQDSGNNNADLTLTAIGTLIWHKVDGSLTPPPLQNAYLIAGVPYWTDDKGGSCTDVPGALRVVPAGNPYDHRCWIEAVEGGGPKTFNIWMAKDPKRAVTVSLSPQDRGAMSVSPAELTFTSDNWNTPQKVSVSGLADSDGLDEWGYVYLSAEAGARVNSVLVKIEDDDTHTQTGHSLIYDKSDNRLRVQQDGDAQTFTVRLRFQPEGNVRLNWDPLISGSVRADGDGIKVFKNKKDGSPADGGVKISPKFMTFTRDNWETPQTFTVTADANTAGTTIPLRPWWEKSQYPYTKSPEFAIKVVKTLGTTVPDAPVVNAAAGDGAVRLTWTIPDNGEGITGWQARYGEATLNEAVDWGRWYTIPGAEPDTVAHTVTGLTNGTSYGFQVRAAVGSLKTAPSNTNLITPMAGMTLDAPGRPDLFVDSGNGAATLSWNEISYSGTITGWQYRYGVLDTAYTVDWGDWTDIEDATAQTLSHTVTGLVNDTRYGIQLRAVAGENAGDMSRRRVVWPYHPPFGSAQVTNVGADSVTVSWELPQDVVGTGLRAEHRVPEGEWQSTDLALDATTHEFTGLEPDTAYNFRIFLDSDTGGTSTGTLVQRTAEDSSLGVLTGFTLVDATDDTDLDTLANNATVQVSADGVYGLRANVDPDGGVQSVVLTLEKGPSRSLTTRTENIAPYSLYGDADGAEHGRALPADTYKLHAVAYSSKDGNGEVLGSRTVNFTVESTGEAAAPAVASFSLVDASNQAVLATLTGDSNTVYLADPGGGSYALRANLKTEITASSVVMSLSGTKTVDRTESMAPYSLWGDSPGTGGDRNLDGSSLPAGDYTLSASAFSKSRGEGTQLGATATVSFTVRQLVQLSVGSAHATEGRNDHLPFNVYLDRESTETVTVNYTTVDGTATAGADYTAASGTLTFAPGDVRKQVRVTVLEDDHDEDSETLTFRISDASGAVISGAEGTGTISNSDALPEAWLARFGRTVGTHVTDAVGERLRGAPGQASHLTIGGYRLPLGQNATGEEGRGPAPPSLSPGGSGQGEGAERALAAKLWGPLSTDAADEPPGRLAAVLTEVARVLGVGPGGASSDPGNVSQDAPWRAEPGLDPRLGQSMTPTFNPDLRPVLLGSSFRLNLGATDAGAGSPRLTAWGRFAGTTFNGQDGDLALDGDVFTGTVGVDSEWDRLLAGVAVAHSRGDGSFNNATPGMADRGRGGLAQTLTSLHPYVRYAVTDRLDVWGLVGYGWGELDLELATGVTLETDTTLVMGAFGGRGLVLAPEDAGGFQLATRTDAMLTRTSSDAVTGRTGNLAAADADAHRVRVILEGSRGVTWDGGQSLTPTVEVGLRHDWGDAETGFGVEVGGRVQYADPGLGLTVEGAVRGLLAHEDSDYQEWGASGTVRLAPGAGGQGLSLTLAPTWGAAASGVEGLWARQTTQGLAPQGLRLTQTGRLQAEVGYGLPAPLGTGLLTPYAGTMLAEGADRTYRVGTRWAGVTGLTLNLEGTRQESAGQQPVNQGVRLQVQWGF